MIEYCLGFMFSHDLKRVALLQKNRPETLAGKWNGIGGKIEMTDVGAKAAMVREFKEEAGSETTINDWTLIGLHLHDGFRMQVFAARGKLSQLETMEDETISIHDVNLVSVMANHTICSYLKEYVEKSKKVLAAKEILIVDERMLTKC